MLTTNPPGMSLFYDVAAALTESNLDGALERTLLLAAEHMRLIV